MSPDTQSSEESQPAAQQTTTLPEYIGAYSRIASEQCGEYLGDSDSMERCEADATHTIVAYDGDSVIEMPRCNEHGEPDHVDVHDREWSGEVEL